MGIPIVLQVNYEVHVWATMSVNLNWNDYSYPWVRPNNEIYVTTLDTLILDVIIRCYPLAMCWFIIGITECAPRGLAMEIR
jgi:hypothetical protein